MTPTRTWIVVDSSFLVYRSQYAIKEEASAVYGFLAALLKLRDRFDTDDFIFCFDSQTRLKRNDLLPTYKERVRQPDQEQAHKAAKQVMKDLQYKILRQEFGFENLFSQDGYEADDLIAHIVFNLIYQEDLAIIVSSDEDMFQLLEEDQTIIYNPNKELVVNEDSFRKQWQLNPDQWPTVKAIAGCSSDNIKGVKGVGEKTAAKFLAGTLPRHVEAYDKIAKADRREIDERLKLIKLPFPGVNEINLVDDKPDWRSVATYTVKE